MKSQVISNKKYFLICTLLLSLMLAVFSPMFLKSVHAETLAQKNKKAQINLRFSFFLVEPQIRLELMTCRLQGGCSTN